MSEYFDAFEVSPVPVPRVDAVAPEPFRGIYGMPAFVTVRTGDLKASVEFWTRGLGFFELFGVPERLVHLRRWAFQDVLLVPGETDATAPTMSVSFACVLSELDAMVERCREVGTGRVGEPHDTPWNTRDVDVITPENTRVVFTAAKPYDPASEAAQNLAAMGIVP
ncbi:VOC family protein [Herbiconiux sp. KACC 21604]|uniref:VOC family protein n=1 Tax=unclassified Herbiconiux TaxID=2618217 RepID=UPI001491E361|nr:VOC family protein [Herbiconiux sp. SALV-R1]QJU54058.1 VOC family protein [Herbiconiux sp. SALV-R1]WPO85099.1 VOC family protein [Herbiconiux sp. KACC 21604]